MTISRSARSRALKLSALGAYAAIAAIAACSSDPSAPTKPLGSAGASSAGAAGASAGAPAAGAPAAGAPAAGAPAAGAPAGGDTSGGAPAGGAGAGGDQNAAGAPAAGAAGAPPVVYPFCSSMATPVQTREALPYLATNGFIPSGYENAAEIKSVACTANSPNHAAAHDLCQTYTYTPDATTPTYAGVRWQRMFDANYTHPPVCVADGVTYVNFWAKGAAGGELITVTAQGAAEIPLTLTNAWKQYQISMAGAVYNTDASGVELGFYWKVIPPVGGTAVVTTFSIDHVEWVNTGAIGTGGAGGAGGTGGTGGSGGSGGAAAGAGGAAAGHGGGGAGGTGGA